ncbi:MAG: tryptophan-rich sensory protein [Alphaproteobacteria bacterium]|nr:tryptophan-rich sensory protein [Alphaproteobacteria bacterium]
MKKISLLQKIGRFIFLLVLVNLIGWVASGYMTDDTMAWYWTLPHSNLNPPDYIFGPVWGILLFLQAVAAYLVWGKASPRWFVLQLALNMLWSFAFFYLRSPGGALVVLVFFILALMANIKSFGKTNLLAGWLIVPTLLWAFFALYLNTVLVF